MSSHPLLLQEMIYQEPREALAAALMSLKEAIPELSVAMQNFIRDKRNAELKVRWTHQHAHGKHDMYFSALYTKIRILSPALDRFN